MTKIIIIGAQRVGKTTIYNRLQHIPDFNDSYTATIGLNITNLEMNHVRFQLLDFSGNTAYAGVVESHINHFQIGLICVDLSKEIIKKDIEQRVQTLTKLSSNFSLILIGTQLDVLETLPDERFKHKNLEIFYSLLNKGNVFAQRIATSAKNNQGINELWEYIFQLQNNLIDTHIIAENPVSIGESMPENEPFFEINKNTSDDEHEPFPFQYEAVSTAPEIPREPISACLFLRMVTSQATKSIAALLLLGGLIALGIGIACLIPASASIMPALLALTPASATPFLATGVAAIVAGSALGFLNHYLKQYLPEDDSLHPKIPRLHI